MNAPMHAKMHTKATHFPNLGAAAVVTCAVMLQACGGGGSGTDTPAAAPPTVSAVSVDRTSYGRLSTFTVAGTNLSSSVGFGATGCTGLAVLAGGSATQQSFTCTPDSTLSIRVAATSAGAEIFTKTIAVPKPRVTLTSSLGVVVVELEPAKAQLTVDNYLAYVNSGFYNGTIFHRVVKDFVVQGGGFTGVAGGTLTPQTGARPAIVLESNKGLSNLRGTIAMARTSVADSATSQFFFNTVDNAFLDYASAASPGYAVFGTIVSGLPIVDAMNLVSTQTVGSFTNVPVTNVLLQTAVQTQ